MNSIRLESALMVVILAAGCACEHGIGLAGDRDASDEAGQPSWDPPIENLGEPGWRESEEPYSRCSGWTLKSWDVWSDFRGVFALVLEKNPGPGHWPTDDPSESPEHHYIAFNDGTGWRELFWHFGDIPHYSDYLLTGVPGGQLIVYSGDDDSSNWDGTEGVLSLEHRTARTLFVVDSTLAYALLPSGLLAFFDGTSWGPYPSDLIPYDVSVLWADRSSLFVAGEEGMILSERDDGWWVHDTGTLDGIRALWGFAGDDVWAGTSGGELLHWNGDAWEVVEWPDLSDPDEICSSNEIDGFWGKDGYLFFFTLEELVRWDGSDFTVLGHWPSHLVTGGAGTGEYCDGGLSILAIWGNDVDEVFLSVGNSEDLYIAGCGYELLLWWDGSSFHWF